MGQAASAVLPLITLGLVVGFSPTLIGISLHAMTRGHDGHPVRLIAYLCLGMVVAATLMLVVFRSVDPQTIIDSLRGRAEVILVRRSVDWVAAVVFLAAGALVFARRKRPRKAPRTEARRTRRGDLFVLGFVNTLLSISSIATLYVVGRFISGLSPNWGWRGAAYGLFVVAVAGPYFLLAYLWERLPGVARIATRASAWLATLDFRPLLAGALAVTGIVFVGLGIAGA